MRRKLFPLTALAALLLQGCYTHAPVRIDEVPVGAPVRARISAAEAERLAEVLGREDRVLYGRVVGGEEGGLLLQVPSLGPSPSQRLAQRVLIPSSDLVELEVRRFDRARTIGVVSAAVAASGYLTYRYLTRGGSSASGSDKPGPNEVIIPILQLRW